MNAIPGSIPRDDITEIRVALREAGYPPVPVLKHDAKDKAAGKRPTMPQWETRCAIADDAEIRTWTAGPQAQCTNTGILCGHLIGLDIDVPEQALAEQVGELANSMLPPTPLVRVGKAPKSLRLYRAEGIHNKVSTTALFLADGTQVQVEALGAGNQFVAFGIHPGTKAPYTWTGQSPLDVHADSLPVLPKIKLTAFLAAAESVLRSSGARTKAEIKAAQKGDTEAKPKPEAAQHSRSTNYPPSTRADVQEALVAVPNTHDWEGWHKIGAAIFDALADDGEDLFKAWSAQSSKYDPDDTDAKWQSYRTSPSTVSAATLFYEARQNGWKPERERNDEPSDIPPYEHGDDNPDLLARINGRCAVNKRLRKRWTGDWSGLKDASGSGRAFALAAALKCDGFSFEDTVAALLMHSQTAEWTRSKGQANGGSELTRIWERIKVEDDGAPDPVDALIDRFNALYMVVNDAGKALLYVPSFDPILKRRYNQRMSPGDLATLYLNETVQTGVDDDGEPVFEPASRVWMHHPNRRQFIRGVTFDPSGNHTDPEVLNLWQGFAVNPRPGSWGLMRDHVLNVICDGNHEHRDYVLNWLSRMVQFPAEQGKVAIVMKGKEGTGKGVFANAVRRIMGQHAMKISNAKHLVGNFNSHLRDCVFLFADEAFFAGDKQHVGVLKSLITEESLTIEAKYANAVETPNFLHLMMASNEEWVVPAGPEARRFMVLRPAETKMRNFAYFKAIQDELDAGGYEAMLHDLLHHDLTGFNVADVPETDGLQEQKKLSLDTSHAWWLDVLHRGYVYKSKLGLEAHFGEWRETETTEVLFAAYTEFAKSKNERHAMAREAFGAFMVQMGGKAKKPYNVVTGEHITDVTNGFGSTNRQAALITKERATGYHLGTLDASRAAFLDATKLTVEWEADDDTEETPK
jgi:hypothetical protein